MGFESSLDLVEQEDRALGNHLLLQPDRHELARAKTATAELRHTSESIVDDLDELERLVRVRAGVTIPLRTADLDTFRPDPLVMRGGGRCSVSPVTEATALAMVTRS